MLRDTKSLTAITTIVNPMSGPVTLAKQVTEKGHTAYSDVSRSFVAPFEVHVWNRRKKPNSIDLSFVAKDRAEVLNASAGGGNTSTFSDLTVTLTIKCDRPASLGTLVGTNPWTDTRIAGVIQTLAQFLYLEGGLVDSELSRSIRGDQ